ncbi:MAG: hypothetical protein DMD97_11925 [Candidatus Rokuibacteriota bacterium]|nr:MAG: hypothetical protein DMD97_11925 [Candidatus Rokubacteria bacterium]
MPSTAVGVRTTSTSRKTSPTTRRGEERRQLLGDRGEDLGLDRKADDLGQALDLGSRQRLAHRARVPRAAR